ncbi:MAG: hypothetical protein HRU20_27330 [Pseudomonadales bacterium]|nr:hypothetical protein [Pseudomonadales bacterium]
MMDLHSPFAVKSAWRIGMLLGFISLLMNIAPENVGVFWDTSSSTPPLLTSLSSFLCLLTARFLQKLPAS